MFSGGIERDQWHEIGEYGKTETFAFETFILYLWQVQEYGKLATRFRPLDEKMQIFLFKLIKKTQKKNVF